MLWKKQRVIIIKNKREFSAFYKSFSKTFLKINNSVQTNLNLSKHLNSNHFIIITNKRENL